MGPWGGQWGGQSKKQFQTCWPPSSCWFRSEGRAQIRTDASVLPMLVLLLPTLLPQLTPALSALRIFVRLDAELGPVRRGFRGDRKGAIVGSNNGQRPWI